MKRVTQSLSALLLSFVPAMHSWSAHAGTFNKLYDFQIKPDLGQLPGPVTLGADNALYGTVANGAGTPASDQYCYGLPVSGCGAVFRYVPGGAPRLIHIFNGQDGARPMGRLHLKGGILYGMTSAGASGYGTLFTVSTNGSGFHSLYTFDTYHADDFVVDEDGNVYVHDSNTLYRIGPDGTSTTLRQLHRPGNPFIGQIIGDRSGNIIGTDEFYDRGYTTQVFRYHIATGVIDVLYSTEHRGITLGGVDQSGTLYGYGSIPLKNGSSTGVLFSLTNTAPEWHYTVLHEFLYGNAYPTTLHVALNGTLVGNTISYLGRNFVTYSGTLFRYHAGAFRVLHKFLYDDQYDGSYPRNVPDVSPTGTIYGTTTRGGLVNNAKHDNCGVRGRSTHGCGIIYTYQPSGDALLR